MKIINDARDRVNNENIEWHDLDVTLNLETGEKETIPIVTGYNMTDSGNAKRLIAIFGDHIRYCVNEKTWYVYDELEEGGGVWAVDDLNKIYGFAKAVVNLIHSEVGLINADDSLSKKELREVRKELSKWAFTSESVHHINAMVVLAQSDPRVTVTSRDFNANPWLINCPNGTLDLYSRRLRAPKRDDLITLITTVPYEPETESREWYERLIEVLGLEKSSFLQRAVGSGLTGINRDKALFAFYGGPNSRKSTLMDAMFKTLGPYADAVDVSTFTKAPMRAGGARADIINIENVRAAQCSEVPDGMIFNDAFIKSMTSGNPKSARGMYEKLPRKIIPITKFYLEMNTLPRINFDDDATFNRFFIVTFLISLKLEDCDPSIKEFLLNDADAQKAIFAWLVQGCYDWQDYGLLPPDTVNAARKDYQKSMNPLASFVKLECVLDENEETTTELLWQRFLTVASPDEHKIVKGKGSFGLYLTKLGFESVHRETGNVRLGIRLRDIDDPIDAPDAAEELKGRGGNLLQVPMNISGYHDTCRKKGLYPSGIQDAQELERDLDDFVDMMGGLSDKTIQANTKN
jgi:putative DNA primase/helicase